MPYWFKVSPVCETFECCRYLLLVNGLCHKSLKLGLFSLSAEELCKNVIPILVNSHFSVVSSAHIFFQRYYKGSNEYVNKDVNICCAAGAMAGCIC